MSRAQTYGAKETSVMEGLEKHNLTRGTDALLHFSSNFKKISSELSWLSAHLVLINCLQNSEIPARYHH